jgi:hypothetical protein
MTETNCSYVSSHGLLKSCDLIILSLELPNIETYLGLLGKGQSIYLNSHLLYPFYTRYWKYIKVPVVLVTGNQDVNFPEGLPSNVLASFLNEPMLLHWFSQNMNLAHSTKTTPIPIGLDYHTLAGHIGIGHPWGKGEMPLKQEQQLLQISAEPISWNERLPIAFCNWHFFADLGDRQEALEKIEVSALFKIPQYQQRLLTWKMQRRFCFVASPEGGGRDCHRTWEALALGCVPIVKSWGEGDSLFEGLPVWIVKDWSEVTQKACEQKKREFENVVVDFSNCPKLSLKYWVDKIRCYYPSSNSTISASL